MASSYTTLVGAPPHPKTFAFRDWYYRLLGLRIAYCAQPRATNYYFAQSGNDSTGSGTQASPYKTLAKAQTLVAANTGLFFNRGDTWTEPAGLSDGGNANVTFGAWGSGGSGTGKPTISGASANQSTLDGVFVSGDGSWVDGLHVTNWGTTSASNYPVRVATQGTNACLVSNCDADTGNYHIFGHDAGGTPGITGGIATFVACTGGGLALSTGTVFVSFAYNGGQEFIVESCVATSGSGATANGSTGVYAHTSGGSYVHSLGIVSRLHCLGGSNAVTNSVAFGNPPAATTPAACRSFEMDTFVETASGNAINVGVSNAVRINGVFNVMPPNAGGRDMGQAVPNCWSYNTIILLDGTNVANTGDYFSWWNSGVAGSGGSDSNFQWENGAILHQNWNAGVGFGFEYYTMHGWGGASYGQNAALQNCIVVANLGQNIMCGINGTLSNGNGYFGINETGQFGNDAHAIQLADQPQVGGRSTSPTAISQLYQSAQPPTDGVVLEYDAGWQPRNRAGQNVGPIEIVTANQLQAAQLVTIIANTAECCGGGSSSGAFAMAVNVSDGANPIPGAAVRISGTQSAGAISTDTAGNAIFALNSGSVTVTTSATGYVGSVTVHTVDNLGRWNAIGSPELSLVLAAAGASLSPGAGQTTAYLTTRSAQGDPVPGITLTLALIDPAASIDTFDQGTFTATSDNTGLLQVLLRQSTTYQARLPAGDWTTFTTGSATSFALPEILGNYTD